MTDRERETAKAKFLEALRGDKPLAMDRAARRAGVNRVTVWRLRQDDPDFDQAVREAQDHQDSLRVQVVEDCLFDRLAKGTASPAETIFFLCNRAPARWRHVATIRAERSEPDGGSVSFADLLKWAAESGKGNHAAAPDAAGAME